MSVSSKWATGILIAFAFGPFFSIIRIDTAFAQFREPPQISTKIDPSKTCKYNPPIVREPYLISNVEVSACAREHGYFRELIFAERITRGIVDKNGSLAGMAYGILYVFSNPEKDKNHYSLVWGPDEETDRWSYFLLNGPNKKRSAYTWLSFDLEDSEELLLRPWEMYDNAQTIFFGKDTPWVKVEINIKCAKEGLFFDEMKWNRDGRPRFAYELRFMGDSSGQVHHGILK